MISQDERKRPGPPKKPPIREEDVQGFKYLDVFFKVLNRFQNSKTHQRRKLFYDQYLALMLLYFFTPALTSLRGIQQATTLEKVQKRLDLKKTSLGSLSERKILKTFLAPNTIYLLDCGYAQYKLMGDIIDAPSHFVIRLKDNAVYSILEEKPLTENDRKAGIQKDLLVTLGCDSRKDGCPHPLRIIQVFHKGDENVRRPSRVSSKKTFRTRDVDYTFLLATNILDLPAETIALLFRLRWQIELFFRRFKCVLGCNHLVALSENGLTIQVYCALIASMLITPVVQRGRKPTKRTFEMITLHFMGWASDEELERHIEQLKSND